MFQRPKGLLQRGVRYYEVAKKRLVCFGALEASVQAPMLALWQLS